MTEDLATAAARLADILAAENAALIALDLPRAGAMLAAKAKAVDAFAAARVNTGRASRGVGTAAAERLRALAEENQRLLENAITVQGRVIGIVARALRRALSDPVATRYGAQGRTALARPTALAVSARA